MSSSKPHIHKSYPKKVIEIKPIEFLRKEAINPEVVSSFDEENIMIQSKLHMAQTELNNLKEQKKVMLQNALDEINKEKENWENEKQLLMRQAHDEGHNAGFEIGKEEAKVHYEQIIKSANEIVGSATKDYQATIEQSDQKIVQLAIHTAEKIIKKELSDDPTLYLDVVTAAIKEIKDQSVISIYLHPDHYEFVLKQKSELMNTLDHNAEISIYIDQEMAEGDCLIEHPFGQIDASIDTQLQQIRDVLHKVITENKL